MSTVTRLAVSLERPLLRLEIPATAERSIQISIFAVWQNHNNSKKCVTFNKSGRLFLKLQNGREDKNSLKTIICKTVLVLPNPISCSKRPEHFPVRPRRQNHPGWWQKLRLTFFFESVPLAAILSQVTYRPSTELTRPVLITPEDWRSHLPPERFETSYINRKALLSKGTC